ncbi:MAG: ABC transporter ATP-binding protein [Oceanicoccus sp.]
MELSAQAISLQINDSIILQSLSTTINTGELVGLIGPNGAGKTSLLKILANLKQPDQGGCRLDGRSFSGISGKEFSQSIAYLEQGAPVYWPLQVRRLVELGRLPHLTPWSRLSALDNKMIEQAMQRAEVYHLKNRIVSTLSGGERLRVLLARIFATDPKIILADEPIAALDPYHQLHTMELFRQHCDNHGSAVVVMHDLNTAAKYCHRLILLDHGKIVIDGPPRDVLTPALLNQVYGIEAKVLDDDSDNLMVIPRSRSSDRVK